MAFPDLPLDMPRAQVTRDRTTAANSNCCRTDLFASSQLPFRLFSIIDSRRKAEIMKQLCFGIVAAAALLATIELAQGATAGHMLKSTTPAADTDQDITGSIKKPSSTGPKRKPGIRDSDVTGSIKPKSNSGH